MLLWKTLINFVKQWREGGKEKREEKDLNYLGTNDVYQILIKLMHLDVIAHFKFSSYLREKIMEKI